MGASKVMIAMSGGVDSSVAALLMQQAGYTCEGCTMQLFPGAPGNVTDAQTIAQRLNMPFYPLDFTQSFREKVVEAFVRSYESGDTPNPCLLCNRYLKFGQLLEAARDKGCKYIATGHFARIQQDTQTGRYLLLKAADLSKDQSYVLYSLTQDQLSHTLLPLGELTKQEVRRIAQENGFLNAQKKDSQDICFIPDGDYVAFMQKYTGKTYPSGDFIDADGKVLGKHSGAVGYTIGQRKGLGLAMGSPVYVCCKDMEKNTVTVGPEESLYATTLLADDWNWISVAGINQPMRVTAKARYRHTEQAATVYPEENGYVRVVFDTPQRALTTGQAVVLYQREIVVGGGIIRNVQ